MKNPLNTRASLRRRISFISFVILAVSLPVFLLIESRTVGGACKKQARAELVLRAQVIASMISQNLRLRQDAPLRGLEADPTLLSAEIFDGEQKVVSKYQATQWREPFESAVVVSALEQARTKLQPIPLVKESGDQGWFSMVLPLKAHSGDLGTIRLTYDLAPSLALARKAVLTETLFDTIIFIVGLLLLNALLHRFVEQPVRKQTETLKSVIDGMSIGVLVSNQRGVVIISNQGAQEIIGSDPKGKSTFLCFAHYEMCRSDGTPLPAEENPLSMSYLEMPRALDNMMVLLRAKDGTEDIWLLVSARPIFQKKGDLWGSVIVLNDISDHKAVEQREARLAAIVHHTKDSVFTVDMRGKITSWNHGAENVYGYSSEEIMGKDVSLFFPPASVAENLIPYQRCQQGHASSNVQVPRLRKDGTLIFLSLTISPIMDSKGEIQEICTIGRDISEVMAARSALKESEERFRNAVMNAPHPILLFASDGKILCVNDCWIKLSGYQREELTTLHEWATKALSFGWTKKSHDWLSVGDSEQETLSEECIIRQKSGTTRVWECATSSLGRLSDGNFLIITVANDITERKRLADDLRRSNQDLDTFASIVSHDLSEPLRTITSYLQLLQRRYQEELDERACDFIEFAVAGSRRMKALMDGLLVYSRAGNEALTLKTTNCMEIIALVKQNIKLQLEQSGTEIVVESSLPEIMADPLLLSQVFQNLITNAIKFRGNLSPKIQISATRESEFWRFAVTDNGIGIKPKDRERIFTMFQRVHGATYPGSGIGLAICKKIIDRHGGAISVESTLGRGSEFAFTIPVRHMEDDITAVNRSGVSLQLA